MSSLDRATPLARTAMLAPRLVARLGLVAVLAGGLAGCFQPMYATNTTQAGPALADKLGDIEIVKINGEIGNELRNNLIFDLTGGAGNPKGAAYKMVITVKSTSSFAIVNTSSGLPEAKVVRLEGDWKLFKAGEEDKPPVSAGQAAAAASIDVSQARFANYSATRDAEKRASITLAEMIKAQLAAYFVKTTPR